MRSSILAPNRGAGPQNLWDAPTSRRGIPELLEVKEREQAATRRLVPLGASLRPPAPASAPVSPYENIAWSDPPAAAPVPEPESGRSKGTQKKAAARARRQAAKAAASRERLLQVCGRAGGGMIVLGLLHRSRFWAHPASLLAMCAATHTLPALVPCP